MNIFLSYSTQDHHYKDEIKKTLSKLEREGKIRLWIDEKNLKAGEEFDEAIEAEIRRTDMFLLLLSRDFWASDYIQTYELPLMLELNREKRVPIIPIVLKSNYDLEKHSELKGINGLPRDDKGDKRLKPIDRFDIVDDAYNIILAELIDIIDSLDKDILPLIQLSKESLKTLNPYNKLEKIQLKNISHMESAYDITIVEYYEDKTQKEITLSFSSEHRESIIAEFQNIKLLVKIKEKFSEQKVISRYDILNHIGATHDTLFPVSSQIKSIKNIIETDDIRALVKTIERVAAKKLLVYGSAGVGKTTTLSSLKSFFTDGLVIIYDSFGGGTYKDFGSQRHLQERILTQIVNELAIELGLELVNDRFQINNLELKLTQYLKKASDRYSKVIIIIDAGDNNVEGANYFDKEPYIPKLWTLNLPKNCYLIMSARGGIRKDLLKATDDVEELELQGFDLEASTEFLLQFFPNIGVKEAFQFYKKTQGNPRIESYLLAEVAGDYEKFQALISGDEQISLENIFEDMWQQALSVIQPSTKEHLEELICLSRPASLDNYILASGIDEKEALKTIETLESGVSLDEYNMIRFQDEDFESFIHGKINEASSIQAHRRIAFNLLPLIDSDIFATKKIAFHLDKANIYQELIEIALASSLSHISDRLERKEIEKDRVDRALNKALAKEDYKNVFKLLFIQAEITKSNDSLNEFLKDYPELLAIYTDEENAVNYYLNKLELGGDFYYDCAYLFVKSNPKKAEEFLKLGNAWLIEKVESNIKNDNYYTSGLNAKSLEKQIIVTFYLHGIERCIKNSKAWKLSFTMDIIQEFSKDFLLNISTEKQEEIYDKFYREIHPFIQALFLVLFNGVGNKPSKTLVEKVTKRLHRYISLYPQKSEKLQNRNHLFQRDSFNIIAIEFSVLAFRYGIDTKLIISFLDKAVTQKQYTLTDRISLKTFDDNFFKIIAISKLKDDFSSIEKLKDRYKGKRESSETIKEILPYYQLYIEILVSKKIFVEIKEEWQKLSNNVVSHWYYDNRHFALIILRHELLAKMLIESNADREVFSEFIQDIKRIVNQHNVIYFIAPILLYGGYLYEAFELIDVEIDRIRKEPDSASEKVDNFNTFAEMVRPYDKDRARYYFELGLEATGGLDDKFYEEYNLIVSLTQESLPSLTQNEKVELFNNHLYIIESAQPYETHESIKYKAIELFSHLDFSLAMEIAYKWDRDILKKIEDSLAIILSIAIKNQELSVAELFPLRYMIKKSSVIDSFLPILNILKEDKDKLFKILKQMIDFIQRNLPSDNQYILEKIEQWLKDNGFNQHRITIKLDKINSFHQSIKVPESAHSTHTSLVKNDIEDWDNIFEPYIENIPRNLKEISRTVKNTYNISELLREGRKRLKNNQRVEWLDAVYKLSMFYTKNGNDELFDCLTEWQYDLNIQKNSDRLVTLFIEKSSFRQLYSIEEFKPFLNYKSKDEISKIILRKRVKSLAYMEIRDIYNLMDKTKELLSKEDIKELVFYAVDRTENYFEAQKTPLVKQFDNQTAFVNLLWKLLGHPDRRERWKARHTVRELFRNNTQYITLFVDKLFEKDGFPFTDDVNFYTISARESLLIVFHRLSYEMEEILKPYIFKFEAILLDEEFPHIIIREIAKSIIFNLADKIDNSWVWANEPKSCLVENKTYGYGWNHETRFSFDSMDTIPNWYNHMQNIFNFEMITLLEKAENWIIDKWGQNDTIRFKDGYWGRGGNNYNLTSHRQGILPIIEEPKRHLEFESMFLVAGELIKNSPVNKGYYDNDKYQDFLARYFQINDFWCSEWRDIKPLEPFVYGDFDKGKEIERYDELLGLGNSKLCLDATYDIYTEGFSETISIVSTLVLPETSDELHRLLEKANHFDYCFPYVDDIHNCQDYKDYDFTAWIEQEYIEKVQDIYDPYSDSFSTTISFPSNEFIQYFDLEENKYKNSYKKDGKEIVKIERWADEDRSNDYEYTISTGDRMWFDFNTILAYLNYKDKDMLIEVRIASRRKNGYKEEDIYDKKSVVYCLKLNGQITKVEKKVKS